MGYKISLMTSEGVIKGLSTVGFAIPAANSVSVILEPLTGLYELIVVRPHCSHRVHQLNVYYFTIVVVVVVVNIFQINQVSAKLSIGNIFEVTERRNIELPIACYLLTSELHSIS
uniref:Uncharacterized protein n=1 Tax=Glossina pallidipes TaxID=7398 RepID=A0A1A9ZDE1_GLOPL